MTVGMMAGFFTKLFSIIVVYAPDEEKNLQKYLDNHGYPISLEEKRVEEKE